VNHLDGNELIRQGVASGLLLLIKVSPFRMKECAADGVNSPLVIMRIRWSLEAAGDFAGIIEYIYQENP
jgi:hypothetical protein